MYRMEMAVSQAILQRKGARKAEEIPAEVSALIQQGRLQTVNLTEWLAVDHFLLLEHVAGELDWLPEAGSILLKLKHFNEKRIMKIIPAIAQEWLALLGQQTEETSSGLLQTLASHRSDSVRCWAAYIIGLDDRLQLEEKLAGIRPFAADSHFGVREIAWMAVRETISRELAPSIAFLTNWVHDPDANIRRFAVEATRPIGVWAKHITALKENPSLALPLLEAVKSDPSPYVQDSAGN